MTGAARLFAARIASLGLAGLSLAPSFAHLLEAPPRLRWPAELWIAVTVFGGQYALFGSIGAVIDVAAVGAAFFLARISHNRPGGEFALGGAILLALSLAVWLGVVFPASQVMGGWPQGSAPPDFDGIRARWETGHALMAGLKLTAFASLILAALQESRGQQP